VLYSIQKKWKAVNLAVMVSLLFQLNSCTYTCRSHLTSSCVSHVATVCRAGNCGVWRSIRPRLGTASIPDSVKVVKLVQRMIRGVQTVQTRNCTHTAWRCRKSTVFPHKEGKMVKKVLSHNMTPTAPTAGFENNELTTNRRWSSNGTHKLHYFNTCTVHISYYFVQYQLIHN